MKLEIRKLKWASFPLLLFCLLQVLLPGGCGKKGGDKEVSDKVKSSKIEPAPTDLMTVDTSDWRIVKTDDYQFRIPRSMKSIERKGIDTHILEFHSETLNLFLEYGNLVSKSIKRPNPRIIRMESVRVGTNSFLVSEYVARSSVRDQTTANFLMAYFDDPVGNENNLAIEIECIDESACHHIAEEIFRSVSF